MEQEEIVMEKPDVKVHKRDVLVIGGGIAGAEAALKLAETGYKVLIVEKDLSLGGKMILLSKVFPTLDCSACITTPKISETARHKNIKILTKAEVTKVIKDDNGKFQVVVNKHPRYVIENICTGCQACEEACPVFVKDEYQLNQVARKAVFIPFDIATPRIANIDIDNCILCGACERACQASAINFAQEEEFIPYEFTSIVIATGFNLFDPTEIERYGYGKYKNVLTAMEMERQLAPTRPFNNVLRPSDGKVPDNIAYVLCTGSRDHTVGNPICSQVCCMYSTKQAQLLMGALPMADVSLYFLHVRAFGKGFCEFYNQAKGMGVEYYKGKIAKITEKENGNLVLRYENFETGKVTETEHDMVVLSIGVLANPKVTSIFQNTKLELDQFNYIKQTDILTNPSRTSVEGVYVAGTSTGPMDIPDAILSAGAAASETATYLRRNAK